MFKEKGKLIKMIKEKNRVITQQINNNFLYYRYNMFFNNNLIIKKIFKIRLILSLNNWCFGRIH
ncbi:hypothetical protein S100390_v1c04680 [Spiroplasma sp. NBRC 100390]|nr:hypothetical protein STU14_v1c04680 [Spiroplasma sp. TU-14]APE13281.1 hypothetical protein S100390_v1c04680 [Spiroplasma sp. NBRC 100390]